MGNWRKHVNIGNALDHDAVLTLEERAAKIDRAFQESGLYLWPYGTQLEQHVEELKEQARTEAPDYFDVPLARIYDWCDEHRVWVETMKGA